MSKSYHSFHVSEETITITENSVPECTRKKIPFTMVITNRMKGGVRAAISKAVFA